MSAPLDKTLIADHICVRRGEHVSDEEEVKPARRKAKAKEREAREVREQWKKPPKKKTVVQHRTYEEIMEAAGQEGAAASGVGIIIDATGATVSTPPFPSCVQHALTSDLSLVKSLR